MSGALGLLHRRIIGQQILSVPEKLHVSMLHKRQENIQYKCVDGAQVWCGEYNQIIVA